MRKTITFAGLLLLLNACSSMSGEGFTLDSRGVTVLARDLGDGQWRIECAGRPASCTERASAICPEGFEILNDDISTAPFGMGADHYMWTVKCDEPDTE